jgi:hypothetical protein
MSKVLFVMMFLGVAAVTACSSDDLSPTEKCDALIDDICAKGIDCFGGSQQECVQTIQRDVSCGSVQGVSSTYDRCVDQVNDAQCNTLFPPDSTGQAHLVLPADCMSVFTR